MIEPFLARKDLYGKETTGSYCEADVHEYVYLRKMQRTHALVARQDEEGHREVQALQLEQAQAEGERKTRPEGVGFFLSILTTDVN